MVENKHLISINYEVKDKSSGEILDSSANNPFRFILGNGEVIAGLEKAVIGKNIGDKFSVEIEPKEAYGDKDPTLLCELPKEQFNGIDLKKGMTLFGQSEDGQNAQVVVSEIGESSVIVDFNHPLAGKTLLFSIEILDSKLPSEDEILELSHSCDAHQCCGGKNHTEHGCGCQH